MWLCSEDFLPERFDYNSERPNGNNLPFLKGDRFEDLLTGLKEAHLHEVSSLRVELAEALQQLNTLHRETVKLQHSALTQRTGHHPTFDGDTFTVDARPVTADLAPPDDDVPPERYTIQAESKTFGDGTKCSGKSTQVCFDIASEQRDTDGVAAFAATEPSEAGSVAAAEPSELGSVAGDKQSQDPGTEYDGVTPADGPARGPPLTTKQAANQRAYIRAALKSRGTTIVRSRPTANRLSDRSIVSSESEFEKAQFELWPAWTGSIPLHGSSLWQNTILQRSTVASNDESQEGLAKTTFFVLHSAISPNAPGRFIWDLAALLFVLFDFVTIPLQVFEMDDGMLLLVFMRITTVFWTVDILASFVTGYYTAGNVVMERSLIAYTYMRTWFIPDLVVVGADWVMVIQEANEEDARRGAAGSLRFAKFVRFLRTIRLMRLAKTRKIVNDIKDRIDSDYANAWFKIFTLLLVILGVNHLVACAWYGLSDWPPDRDGWVTSASLESESKEYLYVVSLHWSLTQFTPASMSVQPSDIIERVFTVVVILFALVIFSSFVSSLTNATSALRNLKEEESRNVSQLRRYMARCCISRSLKLRIERYTDFVLRNSINSLDVTDLKLLRLLSQPLRNELYTELYMECLQKYALFTYLDLHQAFTLRICCSALGPMHLARSDVVFFGGEVAQNVLVVAWGDLQYRRSLDGGQVNVERSMWISDALIWTPWIHLGDMRAIMVSTVVQIQPVTFAKNIQQLPMVFPEAVRYGTEFVVQLNQAVQAGVLVNDIDTKFFDISNIGLRRHKLWNSWSSDSDEALDSQAKKTGKLRFGNTFSLT